MFDVSAAAADEVNAGLAERQRSTVTSGSRYQPGYSADGALQVADEHVERLGQNHTCKKR